MADISGSIFLVKFIHKLHMQNNTTTIWMTKGGNIQTSKKCKTTFILTEFHENKSIEWNLHVDSTPGPHHYDYYDMILGHNVMSKLGIMIHFTMTWDDLTIRIKHPESFLDLLDPINDFFWNNNHYSTKQRCFKKLPLISRKFEIRSMLRQTSTSRTDVRTSTQWQKNINCMPYWTNMIIYSMAP